MTSDSIADMLTRIRNANQAHHRTVEIPVSKMKVEIARVLTEEGFVDGYEVSGEAPMQVLTVTLKPESGSETVNVRSDASSITTESMPRRASRCDSSSPAGPAPTMPT